MKQILRSLATLLIFITSVFAQNTVSFDNQSGEPALVKLIGATTSEIEVSDGHADVVKVLLDKGADINLKTTTGQTALAVAKEKKNTDVVQLLEKAGAKE